MQKVATPSLRHDTLWALFGATAQAMQQAAVMLTLAWLADSRLVGVYALGLALAVPLNVFADRALRTLQATAGADDFALADYLGFRTLLAAAAWGFTAVAVLAWDLSLEASQIVLLVGLFRGTEGITQTIYGRMQRERCMKYIGQSQIIRATASTVAILATMFAWHRFDLAMTLSLFVQLSLLMIVDVPRVRRLEKVAADVPEKTGRLLRRGQIVSIRGVPWKRMLTLAVPLGVSTFLVSWSTSLPRLFLSWTASDAELGVFVVLCYTCFPATLLGSALLQAATPRLADLYRRDERDGYRKLLMKLTLITTGIATVNLVVVSVGGPWLMATGLGSEYAAAGTHLPWIALASGVSFVAAVPATALAAQRFFRLSMITCALSCVAAVVVSAACVPRYATLGAVIAMGLTSGVHLAASAVSLWWCLGTRRLRLSTESNAPTLPAARAA